MPVGGRAGLGIEPLVGGALFLGTLFQLINVGVTSSPHNGNNFGVTAN
jgi:hypothetical protein